MIPFPITLKSDLTLLNDRMAKYATSLKLEPRGVVKMQAGILSRELAEGSAPRSKQALERSIEKDVRRVYSPAPKQMLPIAHRQGKGFMWIMATPRALVGVAPSDYRLDDSADDLFKRFYKENQPVEEKYIPLEKRGKQHVLQLARGVVRRGVYKEFLARLKKRGGILGGSWVVSWNVLQPKGAKPPAYKFRHVQDGTARGTYIDGLGIPGHASFSLVNRATGCTQPAQLEMVGGKVRHRAEAMAVDLKNLLKGAYKRAGFKNG